MIRGIQFVDNLLFIWVGSTFPEKYLKNVERAKEVYPDAKLRIVTGENVKQPYIYSDRARVELLAETPYTLYLDCDAWCKSPIPVDQKGSAGIWALYNHDDLDTFKNILKRMPAYYSKMIRGNRLHEFFEHTRGHKTQTFKGESYGRKKLYTETV